MLQMKTFYVTTPIYYANSAPHLGSLYTTVIADCLRRYKRQRGYETWFLTGTDEHGINIERVAARRGITPQAHVDAVVREYQRMFSAFGLATEQGGYDIFMRTTAPFHRPGVAEMWRRARVALTPKGREAIYLGHYEGWFCPQCAAYKVEDECLPPESEGGPPRCPDHLSPLDKVAEESYFFRLADYAGALLDLYEQRPDFIRPEARRNEVISFVRGGLQDLSVSRPKTSVSWGIPVPDDPAHTIYVWFDALTNYITALGFGDEARDGAPGFEKFWPAVHLVGKDILRFHAVYWPAFLMAAGLPVPQMIYAHGMLLDPQGRKMNLDLLQRYFTNDMVRYFLLREVVFGRDGKVGYESCLDRANSDLASGLGNLLSRTLSMLHKYSGGVVPADAVPEQLYLKAKRLNVAPDAQELASAWELARGQYVAQMDDFAWSRALESVWTVMARVDKMISDAKPWELAKEAELRPLLDAVLYRAAESLRWLSVLLVPALPASAREIALHLGLDTDGGICDPLALSWGGLMAGTQVRAAKALFPRLDKKKIMTELEKETTQPAATAPAPTPQSAVNLAADYIGIEDFAKVDLRVGEVLSAERVPKADKLLLLKVDIGEAQPRQILAGIAQFYDPESLLGRKVTIVANLAPRKLRGYESQGMVVAASYGPEGRPVIATFTEDVPNGARLK
jgi:methionyl-tRNA synthetase